MGVSAANVDMYDGDWHDDFTVYLWWAGIDGTFVLSLPPQRSLRADLTASASAPTIT